MNPSDRFQRRLLLLLACLSSDLPAADGRGLRAELEALAARAGFALEGMARVGAEDAGAAEGTPGERLKILLRDYNYLVVEGRPGVIEKVLITSAKGSGGSRSADRGHIPTARMGAHHQVEATLTGPNGVGESVDLLVDTGASMIVLPASMIKTLGFARQDLTDGTSRTASGQVPLKIGVLRSVRIGPIAAADVEVGFIADRRLNGAMLLGMSFLKRFRVTLDDDRNELILMAK